MDYKELLTKYMRYVRANEGVTFVESPDGFPGDEEFSKEEWAVLHAIHKSVQNDSPVDDQ